MQVDPKEMIVTPKQTDSLLNAASLFEAICSNSLKKYEQSKVYTLPFNLTDEIIRSIDENARRKIGVLEEGKINFDASVAFQDLLNINYDNFDNFLEEAAKERDPERASLNWSMFVPFADPVARYITINFVTEKKLVSSELEPGDFFHAYIELIVCGTDADWVKDTFNSFKSLIDLCKLNGIFRPLWIFRNTFFIRMLSLFIAMFSGFITGDIFRMLSTSAQKFNIYNMRLDVFHKETKVLENIKSTSNIEDKIDILSEYIINPVNPTKPETVNLSGEVLNSFAYIAIFLATYLILYFTCLTLLPKLAPSSHLSIGLNKIRVERHLNTVKFVIFDLLVLGIFVPIIVKLVS